MSTIGEEIKRLLQKHGRSQRWLAQHLRIDDGQVSRWVNGRGLPSLPNATRIDELLGGDLLSQIEAARSKQQVPTYEVFIAAPMAALSPEHYQTQRAALEDVCSQIESHVGSVYWAGRALASPDEFEASDIATERNLICLKKSRYVLLIQLSSSPVASSALTEVGIAFGLRKPTTIFAPSTSALPYMFGGFGAVAERLSFMPRVRFYEITGAADAIRLVQKHGEQVFD